MRIGIFADAHDHRDNICRAVAEFNRRDCQLVIFAGDFVSTFAIPPLRQLRCPLVASFGDNEGNKTGIRGGIRIIGKVFEPPFCLRAADGTRIAVTHQWELLGGIVDDCEVVIFGHTHKPCIQRDAAGRLLINPGETSGWTYRRPSVVVLETATMEAEILWLPELGAPPDDGEDSR
jgi:putative phosphoesterase